MSGSAIQEKVVQLLSRQNGRPAMKAVKPLALKNEVANRKCKKGEATCITEMSLLMACWKQNDFNNTVCSQEVSSFYTCIEKARKNTQGQQEARLSPQEANTLLKRFPSHGSVI